MKEKFYSFVCFEYRSLQDLNNAIANLNRSFPNKYPHNNDCKCVLISKTELQEILNAGTFQ
jgi:hypothetical protein